MIASTTCTSALIRIKGSQKFWSKNFIILFHILGHAGSLSRIQEKRKILAINAWFLMSLQVSSNIAIMLPREFPHLGETWFSRHAVEHLFLIAFLLRLRDLSSIQAIGITHLTTFKCLRPPGGKATNTCPYLVTTFRPSKKLQIILTEKQLRYRVKTFQRFVVHKPEINHKNSCTSWPEFQLHIEGVILTCWLRFESAKQSWPYGQSLALSLNWLCSHGEILTGHVN